jgi:glycosyltransferase involved in cell wall biosynthesis
MIPKVASYAPRRKHNGVTLYAAALEAALSGQGLAPHSLGLDEGTVVADMALFHFELVTAMLHGDVLRYFSILRTYASRGVPIILVAHTVFAPEQLRSKFGTIGGQIIGAIQRAVYHRLASRAKIVVLSKLGLRSLEQIGIDAVYVPLGIYPSTGFSDVSPSPDGELRVGVVGHPYSFKQLWLGANASLIALQDLPLRFIAVGGDSKVDQAEAERLDHAISALGSRGSRTGPLSDEEFARETSSLDIALMPYQATGSASGALSSIVAAGVPMIVSNSPIFDDVVREGGAVRAATWPQDAAAALVTLGADPERRDRMRAALRRFSAMQGIDQTAAAIRELFTC